MTVMTVNHTGSHFRQAGPVLFLFVYVLGRAVEVGEGGYKVPPVTL